MTAKPGISRSQPRHAGTAGSLAVSRDRGDLVGGSAAILQSAARHIVRQWERRSEPPSAADIAELLPVLATNVVETQITSAAVVDERLRSTAGRWLLDQLHRAVVTRWSDCGVPDSVMPPLLLAMERVRDTLEPTPEGMELLVDVAHDLRSPLTSILFLTETMQKGQSGPITDVQRRQLALIYTASLGLSAVASDLIDLSRSEQLLEPAPIPFSVLGVLASIHRIVRPMAEEKKLELRFLGPEGDQRLGHPVALSRVLLNLTTNAIKFTDSGYVEIVTRGVMTNRIDFSVRDSGRGIDPAIVATLFSPMRPTDGHPNRARMFSRTGLGLTICRRLVRAMGSELQVESRPGLGTRFFFELSLPPYVSPRNTPHAARARSPLANGNPGTPSYRLSFSKKKQA